MVVERVRNPERQVVNKTHPILNKDQQRIMCRYIQGIEEGGLGALVQCEDFRSGFCEDDRVSFDAIVANCSSVEDLLTECNSRLVFAVARRYFGKLSPEDAMSAGNIGLVNSAKKWREDRGAKLTTYAVWGIQSEIQKAANQLRYYGGVTLVKNLAVLRRIQEAFGKVMERTPTWVEIRNQLLANTTLAPRSIDNLLNFMMEIQTPESIDESIRVGTTGQIKLKDSIKDSSMDLERDFIDQETKEDRAAQIKDALKALTHVEKVVIQKLYGIGGSVLQELAEISDELGIDIDELEREHISALQKLRGSRLIHMAFSGDDSDKRVIKSESPQVLEVNNSATTAERIIELVNQGITNQSQIGRLLGMSKQAVNKQLKKLEQTGSFKFPGKVDHTEQIKKLRDEGLTSLEISQRLDCSVGTVRMIAAKLTGSGEIETVNERIARIKRDAISLDTERVREYLLTQPVPEFIVGLKGIGLTPGNGETEIVRDSNEVEIARAFVEKRKNAVNVLGALYGYLDRIRHGVLKNEVGIGDKGLRLVLGDLINHRLVVASSHSKYKYYSLTELGASVVEKIDGFGNTSTETQTEIPLWIPQNLFSYDEGYFHAKMGKNLALNFKT